MPMYLCMKKTYTLQLIILQKQQKKDRLSRIHKVMTNFSSNCPLPLQFYSKPVSLSSRWWFTPCP